MIQTTNSKHREEGHIGVAVERALPFSSFLPAEEKSKKAEPSQKDAPLRLRIAVWDFGFVSDFEIRTSSF